MIRMLLESAQEDYEQGKKKKKTLMGYLLIKLIYLLILLFYVY